MARLKPNASFKFDEEIRSEFANNVYLNGSNMTEVLQNYMQKYNELCKKQSI